MMLGHITFILNFINLICLSICSSESLSTGIAQQFQVNNSSYIMLVLIQPYDRVVINNDGSTHSKRVKRQGAGKFADSASMSQTKVMQVWLQMFANTVASSHVGGSHPMHPEAVKPVVKLFKQRIITFFFPDVGDQKV